MTSIPTGETPYTKAVNEVRSGTLTADTAANRLLRLLTQTEVLGLLDGDLKGPQMVALPKMIANGPIAAAAIPRIGFPGIRFTDGPRGVVAGTSTAFPVTMARAATWDPALEEQVGLAMGREARAKGANYSGAVCINLVRHPAWGRAQETYGDDPVLLGAMGAGLTRGLRRNVQACVKHFALNSMENARFKVNVVVDEHALHEVYLPHFKTVVGAGVDSVMSAYNAVNGDFAGENKVLLTDILRDEWGFKGTVTSDWVWGVREGVRSVNAGLDIEMPLRMHRARELPAALKLGVIDKEVITEAAKRVLATTIRHEAQRDAEEPVPTVIACPAHRDLARKVATRAITLLKNDVVGARAVLPLATAVQKIAIIGSLADRPNMGDLGSSIVKPPTSSSPLDGIRESLPATQITHSDGADLAAAVSAARDADVAIVIVGMGPEDEGERVVNQDLDVGVMFGFPFTLKPMKWLIGKLSTLASAGQFGKGGDRDTLTVKPADEELIGRVAAANRNTVVVVIGGSAIIMENWRESVPAILMAWYPGMEGGRALADVITGAEEPGGRLPLAFPTSADHLPYFDADATEITYDNWWGQRKLDHDGNQAAFPLGFGLGYTTFDVELAEEPDATGSAPVAVRVANTGSRPGSTVVQLYAIDDDATVAIPQLVGFSRVQLNPGDTALLKVTIDLTPMRERDPESREWRPRAGTWRIVASQHSPSR